MNRDQQKAITAFINGAVRCDEPLDIEADAIIRALFVRQPDAAYRMTLLAMKLTQAAPPASCSAPAPRGGFGWIGGIFDKAAKARRQVPEPELEQDAPRSLLTER